MQHSIERNNQIFGPYEPSTILIYVNEGKILLQDKVVSNNGQEVSVRDILKSNKLKTNIKKSGNVFSQIQSFGLNLILPNDSFSFRNFKNDNKLLLISIIGLAPVLLIKLTSSSVFTFYAIALYFSSIWGLFYFELFKTNQVKIKKALSIFFIVQLSIFVLVFLLDINRFNPFYKLLDSNSILNRIVGFVFGVGVFEELIKILPVYFFIKYVKEPQIPQTVVFYGLISGIGFGVFEGVVYQINVNSQLGYNESFFMNIARLTSLPFLHSVWTGISAYFLSFSFINPTKRYALWFLAILIPAIIHGLYDVFTWSLIGLFIAYLGVALLVLYLKKAKEFQNKITF
jgi:RsiW-degrading membrane proteinase PrsW (M82 family)